MFCLEWFNDNNIYHYHIRETHLANSTLDYHRIPLKGPIANLLDQRFLKCSNCDLESYSSFFVLTFTL